MVEAMLKRKTSTVAAAFVSLSLIVITLIMPSTNISPSAETTFHQVTVNVINGEVSLSVEPWVTALQSFKK